MNQGMNSSPMSAQQPGMSGLGILENASQQQLGAMRTQGAQAVGNINNMFTPGALQNQQNQAMFNAGRGIDAANNTHDSAMEQYGIQMTPAQERALQRERSMNGASARAAASSGTADRYFERRLATIADAAGIGQQIEQQGLQGIQQAESVRQGIASTNQGLQDDHNSGIASLVGTVGGLVIGGPAGAGVGGAVAGAIF